MTTINDLLAQLQRSIDTKNAEREAARAPIAEVRAKCAAEGRRDPSPAEARCVQDAQAAVARIDAEIQTMRGRMDHLREEKARDDAADSLARQVAPVAGTGAAPASSGWSVGASERQYRADDAALGRPSFLRDLYGAQILNDPQAHARLGRHGDEVLRDQPGFAQRAVTTGAVAGFTPPQYLVALFAELGRAGRPVANLCTSLPLPATGMTINVPRVTTGTAAAVQASEGGAIGNTDIDDTVLAVPVVTVAGYNDVSRQAVERGEMVEALILGDLAADYGTKLDAQVISGTGAAGQHTGLLTVAGTNSVTYTDATPTVAEMWPKIADAVRKVASQRFTGATAVIMHPLTWGWIYAQVDSSGRPLVDFHGRGQNPTAIAGPPQYDGAAGSLFGVPVYLSGNVPTNLGAGTNETAIIAADMRDVILLEDPSQAPAQLRFDSPLSSTLGVRLLAYGYSALASGRQPGAISKVTGTGLILPAL